MATFDDVTSKAKGIFDSVSKKTGEFVGVQKLRIEAADIKNKLNKLYCELGEAVYKSSVDGNDCAETIKELIESIGMKNSELAALQCQIDVKQNKRVCPSCGKANDADAEFCSSCGIKLTYSYSDDDFETEDTDDVSKAQASEDTAE